MKQHPDPAPWWAAASPGLPLLSAAWLEGLLAEAAECAWVEFKQNHDRPETIAEYVSALANGAAWAGQPLGWLVWGVQESTRE
jgi:predicted HTH transcriptional regulator